MTIRPRGLSIGVAVVLTSSALLAQDQRPQFRGGVTLVPIEVRAVDRDGRPVTDLTAADFVIREAGEPQEIAHFRAVAVDGAEPAPRTFFFVLGRGRLNHPTKALQGLIDFVKGKLLPNDRVGVLAYLRLIDPTTDHARVIAFLERFRDQHERIEGLMAADRRHYLIPLPPQLGKDTKAAIDRLFESAPTSRNLAGSTGDALGQLHTFTFLRRSLEHLQTFPEEKHVVLIDESPLGSGRVQDDPAKNFWFRFATDARATLSYIHAGGQRAPYLCRGCTAFGGYNGLDPRLIEDHDVLATQTGGMSAFYRFAEQPLTALDLATRFHYELAYYPTRQAGSDAYRTYEIAVTRPGVRLLYRHGYVAQPPPTRPAEHETEYRRNVTASRLNAAALRILNPPPMPAFMVEPWQVRLRNPTWAAGTTGGTVRVEVAFDARRAWVAKDGDGYVTDIDLLLIADDAGRNAIAERRIKLNIRLTASDFARTRGEFLQYDATIDVPHRPAHLRAVLYDFENDRTAITQVRLAER
jgi:VWFA-related protein